MLELFANIGDPDQMPCSAASDLYLHCLPVTFYGSPDCNGLRKFWCISILRLDCKHSTQKYQNFGVDKKFLSRALFTHLWSVLVLLDVICSVLISDRRCQKVWLT